MLVKMRPNSNHYDGYKYEQYIFRVIQFIRHNDTTFAIVLPFKTKSWKDIEIKDYYYSDEISPKRMIEIGIYYLEVILDQEIPEDAKRDIKLNQLLNI